MRNLLLRGVLWVGLILAAWIIWQQVPNLALSTPGLLRVALWTVPVLLAIWALLVLAWKKMLLAFTGCEPGWSRAARNLGLLLVGKYIPGGIVGFVARANDVDEGQRALRGAHIAAGIAEQLAGLLLTAMLGAVFYASAYAGTAYVLLFVPVLPVLVAAPLAKGGSLMGRVPSWRWLRKLDGLKGYAPGWQSFLQAHMLMLCSAALWAVIVVMLATEVLGMELMPAIGVSGAFALAVVVGMVVVVAPGGIGAREAAFVVLAAPWLDAGQAIVIAGWMRLMTSALDLIAAMVGLVPSRIRHLLD